MTRIVSLLATLAWAAITASPVYAQAPYPSKPVHVIVPFLAGGTVDALARIVAAPLSDAWGQPVLVENKPGAGGNVGAELVAHAPPDGYEVLFAPPSPYAVNQSLYRQMPFDPRTAFAPISVLASMPNILVVGRDSRFKTFADLLAFGKANPGKLDYGSQGVGTTPHLTGVMLASATGLALTHVPYRGFPPAYGDLVAGRLSFMFADAGNVLARIRAGDLRALATAGAERFPPLPDTPTLKELGYPDVVSTTWMSFAAPAGTPTAIVDKWYAEIRRILKAPETVRRFAELGVTPVGGTPDEMRRQIESEIPRWAAVVKRAGITPE